MQYISIANDNKTIMSQYPIPKLLTFEDLEKIFSEEYEDFNDDMYHPVDSKLSDCMDTTKLIPKLLTFEELEKMFRQECEDSE